MSNEQNVSTLRWELALKTCGWEQMRATFDNTDDDVYKYR